MKPLTHHRPGRWRRALMVLAVIPVFVVMTGPAEADVPNEDCAACHEEIGEMFAKTSHGVYLGKTAEAEYSCESCHGPGEAHVDEADPALIVNPANHDQFSGRETCLECHQGHQFDDWDFSGHRSADITCADCHRVHVDRGESAVKTAPEMCYDCHSDVRAATYMPSHHPIAEGIMSCLDCHNVHGGTVDFAMNDGGRELCFSCHAGKEGPFLFEHAPVNEDCMICHTPHGAVADNLLKQSEPTLCLNCHAMHFHASVESMEGRYFPNQPDLYESRAGTTTEDGWKKGMLTKCTQCHTEIHGTDLPSQSISGEGRALTR